jgi:hypothetical protein
VTGRLCFPLWLPYSGGVDCQCPGWPVSMAPGTVAFGQFQNGLQAHTGSQFYIAVRTGYAPEFLDTVKIQNRQRFVRSGRSAMVIRAVPPAQTTASGRRFMKVMHSARLWGMQLHQRARRYFLFSFNSMIPLTTPRTADGGLHLHRTEDIVSAPLLRLGVKGGPGGNRLAMKRAGAQ